MPWLEDMRRDDIKALQRDLNEFTEKHLYNVTPLIVDGKNGTLTRRRVRQAKYWLGFKGTTGKQSNFVSHSFRVRLRHPKQDNQYTTPERLRIGKARRTRQREQARKNEREAQKTTGVGTFDGRPCANILIPHLTWARRNGWQGRLNSGWRDPEYSEDLCYRMCNRPSCPGRCAGKASNHVGTTKDKCAVDVSDYVRFGQLMRRCPHEPRIFNALGAQDPVHHSPSGR